MTTVDQLRAALRGPRLGEQAPDGPAWLAEALARVGAEPAAIGQLFPAAGRHCGRSPLAAAPDWCADEAVRALLLAALPAQRVAAEASELYRYGDAAEKRAVLKALPLLPVGATAVPLLHDAVRSNDPRLIAAALGPYAGHLDPAAWRQAVLKCVFMGISLRVVDRLEQRADPELAGMLASLAAERAAAGRALPADAAALLARLQEDD